MNDGLEAIFLRIAPADIALVKFLLESYEGVGIIRTMERRGATIVLLVTRDFLDVARAILTSLRETVTIEEVPPPSDAGEDWLIRILWER